MTASEKAIQKSMTRSCLPVHSWRALDREVGEPADDPAGGEDTRRRKGALCLRPVVEIDALEGNRDAALSGEFAGGGPVDAGNPRVEKGAYGYVLGEMVLLTNVPAVHATLSLLRVAR